MTGDAFGARGELRPGVLGIAGSPRRGGNSDHLLDAILGGVRTVVGEVEAVRLRDYRFESCTGCERCRVDRACTGLRDGMTLLYPSIVASRGLVLVTPVHNYNVSALAKAFIDRCYCFYDFEDPRPGPWSSRLAGQERKAVVAAVAEQPGEEGMGVTLEAMRLPLEALGYEVIDALAVPGMFDRGVVRRHPEVIDRVREAGRLLGTSLLPVETMAVDTG